MADKQSLEGSWQKLMRAGTYGENSYSPSDLDEVVSNFDPGPSGASKIPVLFGNSDGGGPIVAKVSKLRRNGDTVSGQLTEVDPRIDQLNQAGKLGTRQSFTVKRTPAGLTLDKVGIHAPRVFVGDVWRDGPGTDAALTDLANASTQPVAATLDVRFAGTAISFTEGSTAGVPNLRGAARIVVDGNSLKLNDLAVKRSHEQRVSFSEALITVAAEHPELTVPSRGHSAEQYSETFRFQTNSERLSELAGLRQREDRTLSFGECLSQVAAENPRLTLPDGFISFEEETPKSNGQQLSALAYKRAREEHISFGEALAQCSVEHPELTLPDVR